MKYNKVTDNKMRYAWTTTQTSLIFLTRGYDVCLSRVVGRGGGTGWREGVNLHLFMYMGTKVRKMGAQLIKGGRKMGKIFLQTVSPSRGIKEFSGQHGPLNLCCPDPLIL